MDTLIRGRLLEFDGQMTKIKIRFCMDDINLAQLLGRDYDKQKTTSFGYSYSCRLSSQFTMGSQLALLTRSKSQSSTLMVELRITKLGWPIHDDRHHIRRIYLAKTTEILLNSQPSIRSTLSIAMIMPPTKSSLSLARD